MPREVRTNLLRILIILPRRPQLENRRIFFRRSTKFPKVFSNNVWRAQIINSPVHYSVVCRPTYPSTFSLKTTSSRQFLLRGQARYICPPHRTEFHQFRNQTATRRTTTTTTTVDNGSTCLHNLMRSEFKIQRAVGTGTEVAGGHTSSQENISASFYTWSALVIRRMLCAVPEPSNRLSGRSA